jgi:hypothetical protein
MIHLPTISRRTALKGLGAAVGLPLLEAMLPGAGLAARASAGPRRLAFLYVPNGIHMQAWTPATEGAAFELPATLKPLAPFREEMLVLSGLTLDKARPHGDGGGDHARAMASFLTGCQAKKTYGANIHAGISADQVAAKYAGKATRFPSLEIGCEGGRNAGNCDSGYSCAYSANLAWRTPSTPLPKEVNPRLVFERLFSTPDKEGASTRSRLRTYQRSILDFVTEDARTLQRRLGRTDQRKLDEYLAGVREIEQRLARSEKDSQAARPADYTPPSGVPQEYQDHLRLMADMMVLAFQADLTRISTFVFANEGSNRNYRQIGVSEGHHSLSHHRHDPVKYAKLRKINHFHIEQFAYLLGKLKDIKEGDRTLLDNCMIVYGSGNSDGNRHNHDNLPLLLMGKGGGTLGTGRHLRYPRETPLMNLHLSLLDRMGAPVKSIGDSTGRLDNLAG